MRFIYSALTFLALSLPSIFATDVSLTFGANFNTPTTTTPFVQGGYTVVDNANFVNGLNGQIGTLVNVRWRFDLSPTTPPPTSVLVKILQQHPTEPWRFQLIDERQITVRQPIAPETYDDITYKTEVYKFWNNPNGIDLTNLPTGYTLTTPGQNGISAPPSIVDHQFVGFYFYDSFSQVAAYSANPSDNVIEWAMPGNFDWKDQYSPEIRFRLKPGASANPTGADQLLITAQSAPNNVPTLADATIGAWNQYRDLSVPDLSNIDVGYKTLSENEAHWKEGFIARQDHKDMFGFTVVAKSGGGGLGGDPQFAGFQGQNFQFHGMADEVFSLISTPDFQLNGNFRYLSSGNCNYNETLCWTHPGTYVDQLGFLMGDIRIKLAAGSHSAGLQAYMNDIQLHASKNNKIIFAIANSSVETGSVTYTSAGHITVDLPLFTIDVTNSDYFFNLEVVYKDQSILKAGRKQMKLRELMLCTSQGMTSSDRLARVEKRMADFYPRVAMHGLIGQTWRNAVICDHAWVGDASDYVTSGLFAADSAFNYYGTK